MTFQNSRNAHAVDIRTTCPRLRDGLSFVPQSDRHRRPWFRIEDDLCNRFHRVGAAEYEFLLALDGRNTMEQAREQAARASSHRHVLSAEQAESLVLWAAAEGLLEGHFHSRHLTGASHGSSLAWIKIPLVHGNPNWQTLIRSTGWLFERPAVIASVMVWSVACGLVLLDRDRFADDVSAVLSQQGWLTVAGVWLVLKIIHELGHLVCCQRYGGRVGEIGIAWMLIAPVAYVDLTDLYRMKSRAHRIFTCLAGVFVELNAAALAALAWSCSSSAVASHLFATIAVTASAGSLLFNLNPLMRLDGYHALSDWIGQPNLGTEGANAVHRMAARIFFGRKPKLQSYQPGLAMYGAAALGYRMFVTVGLVAAALSLYGRAGLLIVATVLMLVALPAAVRFLAIVYREFRARPAVIVRFGVVLLLLAASMGTAWKGIHSWQYGWCGVVEYVDDSPVRCASAGKVIRVLFEAGQQADAGDALVELENLSLVAELAEAECELAAGQAKYRRLQETYRRAEAASEQQSNAAIEARLAHLQRQVDNLILRAPRRGTVVARDPEHWTGKWFSEGEAVLYVVDQVRKKIVVAIPQDAMGQTSDLSGTKVRCHRDDGVSVDATVTSITPRADVVPPHPALAASAGGPLAVRPDSQQDEVTLLSPHLRLEATFLDAENRFAPGQYVRVDSQ